jgi:hypothetical protein
MDGCLTGIEAAPNGKTFLQNASKLYGSPEGSPRTGIALLLDDPSANGGPRWAIGWCVTAGNVEVLQKIVATAQIESGLMESIRTVRLGRDRVLRAMIPWRTQLTPSVGELLHGGEPTTSTSYTSVPPIVSGTMPPTDLWRVKYLSWTMRVAWIE